MTVTVAGSLPLPPGPVQVTVTLNSPGDEGVNDFMPDVAVEPSSSEPLQLSASMDDQVSVLFRRGLILAGLKLALTVGRPTPLTVTEASVSLAKVLPSLSRNVTPEAEIELVDFEPLRLQANLPRVLSTNTHGAAAFCVDQVTSVAQRVLPLASAHGEGEAEMEPVGSGTVTVSEPTSTQAGRPSRSKHTVKV